MHIKEILITFVARFSKHNIMIIINVKENESIDRALKRFKKKFEKTGVIKELRSRSHFEKPSITTRAQVIKAKYRQRMSEAENS